MPYASELTSTAMPERIVHGSGRLPPDGHFLETTIPHGVGREVVAPACQPR